MKITKFVHSCVLVEDIKNGNILYDPGTFSFASGIVKVEELPKLNYIVVSHKHPDHFSEEFASQLIDAFSDSSWIVPSDLKNEVELLGTKNVISESTQHIEVSEDNHAPVAPFGKPVKNITTHAFNKITHPGDTHQISETRDLLLVPFQAPWGTTIRAIEIVLELKPKYVMPIHDWMWNDQWRLTCYDRFEALFEPAGITFLRPTDGQSIEINL